MAVAFSNSPLPESLIPVRETHSTFHPHSQRNAFRRRNVRQQSRSFARWNQRLRRSPNSSRLCWRLSAIIFQYFTAADSVGARPFANKRLLSAEIEPVSRAVIKYLIVDGVRSVIGRHLWQLNAKFRQICAGREVPDRRADFRRSAAR